MKARKKPVVIDAIKHDATNWDEVYEFLGGEGSGHFLDEGGVVRINTLEGQMTANIGDWIIKGVKGEFYPCKPEIFEATYEDASKPNPYREVAIFFAIRAEAGKATPKPELVDELAKKVERGEPLC